MAKLLNDLNEISERLDGKCDKDCEHCPIYLPAHDMCFHESQKKWEAWNRAEHERFGKILKGAI